MYSILHYTISYHYIILYYIILAADLVADDHDVGVLPDDLRDRQQLFLRPNSELMEPVITSVVCVCEKCFNLERTEEMCL